MLTSREKQELKDQLVSCLKPDKDIRKVVIFGSFIYSGNPQDMDVAVFQDSREDYLSLALKYRKRVRSLAGRIAIDIFPVKSGIKETSFLTEIENGETVYER